MAGQICVVRRGNIVVRKGVVHILLFRHQILAEESKIWSVAHEGGETFKR